MSQLAKTLRCTYYLKQVLMKKCQWALGGPSMFDDAMVDALAFTGRINRVSVR